MKIAALCFGIALSALPLVATAAAPGVEDCYYYRGHHYAYRWNGHYWRYRWNGGYYNYHYGGAYYRYHRYGHYYNYYHGHRYYRDRYRCNPHGWCYR
jgi:hypothetical protein